MKIRDVLTEQGVAEGSEQVYRVLAVDKSNALSKQVKLKVKASSLDEVFERLAVSDWYPLEINGVEVIAGKRLKQGVREGHADQQRKIVKQNGRPVGEIGIDRESSPGVGQYYMKHYASGTDNSGYDSAEEALGDLRHVMKQSVYGELREQGVSEGPITERSKDYYERERAADAIGDLIDRLRQDRYKNVTPDVIRQMRQWVNTTGRARTIYGGENHDRFGSAGELLDMLGNRYRELQMRSGQMPEFQGRANTARDMAQQIAQQTRGEYDYNRPRTWTTGAGQRYRDPQDYIRYPDEQSLEDARQWLESRGQKVYYRDNFGNLNTAIRIGRYVVEPASITRGAFSRNPETEHRMSVRSAAAINQGVRTRADITDQQAAALKDIAATRNATAMAGIQAMMAVLQGEQDLKRVIDSSKKIDPRDKAKLDAIIAAAGRQQGR